MPKRIAVGYNTLITQSKEQGLSPIEFIAKMDKDSYDAFTVEKNVRRFVEDINDEIKQKENSVEDLKDSIPSLLRDIPTTRQQRMELVKAITARLAQIEDLEADIVSLSEFQDLFLDPPEAE